MKTPLICISLALATLASAADPNDLIRLYEEEVLAHDLYVELGRVHPDIRPFQNIPRSEERHRQVMAGILEKEGIAIPEAPDGRRFATDGLDRIHRQWLAEGRKSEVDACRVGVRLEDHDIADLRRAQQDFPDHRKALAQLEAASNHHFRAFHRNLTRRGGSYEPEALAAADIELILGGEGAKGGCGGNCGKGGDGASSCGDGCGGGCKADSAQKRGGPGPGPGPGRGAGVQRRQRAGQGEQGRQGGGGQPGRRGPGGPPKR